MSHFMLIALAAAVLAFGLAAEAPAKAGVTKAHYANMPDGTAVDQYTLTNANGMTAKIVTYGGIVTELWTPDRNGKKGDVVLGFDNLDDFRAKSPYFGALIGRVGNRIANATFTLNGKTYKLFANNGKASLHGGKRGFDKYVWKAQVLKRKDPALKLSIVSPNGDEGYPGAMHVEVIYSLTPDNGLKIEYKATTDKATPVNLTNHTYFNLACKDSILQHQVVINADKYTAVNPADLIPTGKLPPVKGTPLDFTKPHAIGERIKQMPGTPTGYDHNFCLRNMSGRLSLAARVTDPSSGRVMSVYTTEPGIQFYTGNFLDGSLVGKNMTIYNQYAGFCMETQHYPDSIHHKNFPDAVLRPGHTLKSTTICKFTAK